MIIICLLWGAALLPLAGSVEVVNDGCGGSGDNAGERIEAVDVYPRVMEPMYGQKLACFLVKFQEFTFIPLDDSKGVSHH
eukprot:5589123-Ditylum_brightwellii.AAC.1